MNKCVIDVKTHELIAYISDEYENIIKDGFEIINFDNNEPIFVDIDGAVYVKENSFEMNYHLDGEVDSYVGTDEQKEATNEMP